MNKAMLIFTVGVFGVILGSFDGPPATCCLELRSSRVSLEKVLNYRIQTKGLCPIKAVDVFTLVSSLRSFSPEPIYIYSWLALPVIFKAEPKDAHKKYIATELNEHTKQCCVLAKCTLCMCVHMMVY
uniref:Chemokine ligand 32a n=1 Tax=Ctenopharyngodon idella TaxID=7959 RepID=A0A345D705_CTEID|nr:chemokine ligand 32a [Ctenopharyngodon idella]